MNNTFQFNRFRLLLRKIWIENARIFGLGLLATWGVILAFYIYKGAFQKDFLNYNERTQIMFFIMIMANLFLTNFLLKAFSNKQGSMAYLTHPTSSLEKILSVIFYSLVLYIPVYFLVFFSVDTLCVLIHTGKLSVIDRNESDLYKNIEIINLFHRQTGINYLAVYLLILQAYAMWASTFFNRFAFVKGTVAFFAIVFGFSFLNEMLVKSIVSAQMHSRTPFGSAYIINTQHDYIQLPETLQSFWQYFFAIGLPLFLWFLAYLRLKEKEV